MKRDNVSGKQGSCTAGVMRPKQDYIQIYNHFQTNYHMGMQKGTKTFLFFDTPPPNIYGTTSAVQHFAGYSGLCLPTPRQFIRPPARHSRARLLFNANRPHVIALISPTYLASSPSSFPSTHRRPKVFNKQTLGCC